MNKRYILAIIMSLSSLAASAQLSYPGSSWASMTINPSVVKDTPEDNNILLQGNLEQGIVWKQVGDYKLNTYGSLNYSLDKNSLSYNNKLAPSVGIKLQKSITGGSLDLGLQITHQRNFRGVSSGSNSGTGVQAYVQYWTGWNLKR